MTPPTPHPAPDGHWLELLAAYVDDELDEATRARVEQWLAAHPEAKATLWAQQKLSPNNWRFWQQAEPRMPSEDTWARVRNAVAAGAEREPAEAKVSPSRRPGWKWVAGGIAIAATAASWFFGGTNTPQVTQQATPESVQTVAASDPHAGVAVLPITAAADVVFFRVPGNAAAHLPVGVAPLDGKLVLASADDVRIEEAEPTATWPTRMTPGPGDMPMIFASKP